MSLLLLIVLSFTSSSLAVNAKAPGRTMHVLFGEKKGRASQKWSQNHLGHGEADPKQRTPQHK
jgi:hypothetical protein